MLNLKSNKHPDNVVNKNKIRQRPVVFLLLGADAISLAPIFVRLSELGPSATAFYRIFFALPVFSPKNYCRMLGYLLGELLLL